MRKLTAWLLAGLLLWFGFGLSGTLPVLASDGGDIAAESAAVSLKALNLFDGTRNGFDLYRAGTRAEGAVMLVRLLGREPEAHSRKLGHPFKDVPSWAAGQVGLLYGMGLTTGISETAFGSDDPLTGRQYGTFVLRALGYADGTEDVYVNAIPLLSKLGLLERGDTVALSPDSPILRADMVKLASEALAVVGKGQSRTLMDNLVLRGQVPVAAAGKWLAGRLVPKLTGTLTDPYGKYLAFHDWLINKNSYGWLSETEDPKRILSGQGYSALSFGTGICGAYARAMLMLCEAAGIPCRLVLGEADGGTSGWTRHAWNLVQIDGSWYHMDVTFDDPVGVTVLRYNYFNVTDEDLAWNHRWDRTDYPACTATAGGWFVRNDLEVASMAEFNQSLAKMVQNRGTGITLRIKPVGTGILNEGAVRDIMIGTGAVSGYTISLDSSMGVVRLTDVRYFADGAG
jgi:hypothetical protein